MSANPIDARHAVHLVVLPLLVGLERVGYYGARAVVMPLLVGDLMMSPDEAYGLYRSVTFLGMIAPLAGALLAALFGPYAAMVLGAAIAAASLFGLSASPESAGPLLVGLALGTGLYKPGVWVVAAAQIVGRPHARTALFTMLYVAVNVGAVIAAPSIGAAYELHGPPTAFLVAGMAMAPVPLIALVLWAIGHGQTWPEPDLQRGLGAAGVALAVLLLASPFWALVSVAGGATWTAQQTFGVSMAATGWLQLVNPVVVIGVGLLAVVGWIGAQLLDLRVADVVFLGVALMAGSAGAFAVHPVALGVLGVTGLGVGNIALALSEAIAMPVAMSRIAGDSHWRAAALFMGLWPVTSGVASYAGDGLAEILTPDLALPILAFATGVGGLLLVVLGLVARGALLEPLPSDDGGSAD